MFENLSDRLKASVKSLTGKGRITEANVKDTLRQVRLALLEADVALPVVKSFIDKVRDKALGQAVMTALSPGQAFVKIIHEELTDVLGGDSAGLDFRTQPPLVILLAGLQGAGKTTTAAKLARRLIERDRKKTLLASVDVHRPAAMLQLERLAGDVGAGYVAADPSESPLAIVERAREEAATGFFDVLIVDTAGRLHIDGELMAELKAVHSAAAPHQTLFVIDAMAGQDAVNAARSFADELPLTGSIVTKADGDARGGVALSVREITGQPILYLGVGEKTEALEAFHPERMASRILGMGDVLTLVEEVEQKVDRAKAEKLAGKLRKGKGFDLGDMRDQLQQMLSLGGMSALMDKLPIPGKVDPAALKGQADDRTLRRQIALINSMTPKERRFPKVINGSRKRRIAAGAGLQVQDVNRLLKQHMQMEKMMKRFSKGGMKKLMRGLPGGGMPPGLR
ncbi:MAG: signal recognition particle protein [Pseudomonadota bacterium]